VAVDFVERALFFLEVGEQGHHLVVLVSEDGRTVLLEGGQGEEAVVDLEG
jgi:hypothetical protein